MPRLLPCLFAALCLLLLPSCVYWDIGGNIRALAERQVAVNPFCQYRCGDVVVAPECCYHKSPWVASIVLPHNYFVKYYTYGEEYTGRYRVYERKNRYLYGSEYPLPVGEVFDAEGKVLVPISEATGEPLPAGEEHALTKLPVARWCMVRNTGEEVATERSGWYPLAAVLAAPFDYLLDPVLTVVTAPFAWIYIAVDTQRKLAEYD